MGPQRRSNSGRAGWLGVLGLAAAGLAVAAPRAEEPARADWIATNGDRSGRRYSLLDQVNRENVARLQVAWTYHTGDATPEKLSNIECTPVVVGGVMYVTTCSPRVKVDALDAATGRRLWRYDPWLNGPRNPLIASGGVNRGVAYWSNGKERRVLLGTADARLISLDPETGRPVPNFGSQGILDLRAGLERDTSRLSYGLTSPPAICGDLVIACGFFKHHDMERVGPGG